MIVGGYTLDLYCDCINAAHPYGHFPYQYFAERGPDCKKQARADGWVLRPDGKAICPLCRRMGLKPEPEVEDASGLDDIGSQL